MPTTHLLEAKLENFTVLQLDCKFGDKIIK